MIRINTTCAPRLAALVRRRKYGESCWLIAKNRFYEIDDTTDAILSLCDGQRSIAGIADLVARRSKVDLGEALAATVLALEYCRSVGLLET